MLRASGKRHGFRSGRRLAVLAATVVLAAAAPGVASASVTWTIQTVPLPSGDNSAGQLSGVSCVSSTFCMAATFDTFGVIPHLIPGVEIWNGSVWSPQELPYPPGAKDGSVYAVSCSSVNNCVAVGYWAATYSGMLAEVWNGSTWTAQAIPQAKLGAEGGTLNGISCASPTSCTAVGSHFSSGDPPLPVPLAEHWNGTDWKRQAPPGDNAGLNAVSCPSAANCTAVGYDNKAKGVVPLAEDWKAGKWQVEYDPVPTPDTNLGLSAVSCVTPDICFAAGSADANQSSAVPITMRTIKGSWTDPVSTLPKYAASGELYGISCTVPKGTATVCTATGYLTTGTTLDPHALIQYWNGHAWVNQVTPRSTPPSGKRLAAVSCVPATTGCEAVGMLDHSGLLAEGN